VLRVEGVDYECLDHKQTDSLTKRLESALRLLGPQFRVYQLLFKSSGETIPHGVYDNPVVKQRLMTGRLSLRRRQATCTPCGFTT